MLELQAVVTLVLEARSLADVEDFLEAARSLGASPSDVVLGGGNVLVEGFPVPSGGLSRSQGSDTVASLAAWLEAVRAAGVARSARVSAPDLALDVPVVSARPVPGEPLVVVELAP